MLKSSRRLMSLFLVIFLSLVGCKTAVEEPPKADSSQHHPMDYQLMGKTIYSPIEIPYIIENPIEIELINISENENHHREYIQISGLMDKVVEDKINQSIKLLFEQQLPYVTGEKLPPYRGIEAAIQNNYSLKDSRLTVTSHFNSNNVLSVVAYADGTYFTNGNVNFAVIEALNFDLTTGNTFSIEDVFTNDVDGLAIVNEAIMNELKRIHLVSNVNAEPYDYFTLIAPFKGIEHNQKFYITNTGIHIIIDYNHPEFEIGFLSVKIMIPFLSKNGHIGITERFYDKNNSVFIEKAKNKQFLIDIDLNRVQLRDSLTKNGIQWYISTGRPKQMPERMMEIMKSLQTVQEESVTRLTQVESVYAVEQNVYINRIGPFYNFYGHLYISSTNKDFWQTQHFVYSKNGDPITLEDLFIEGYDYQTLLMQAIDQANKENGSNIKVTNEKDLMFSMNETSISFFSKTDDFNQNQLFFYISYEEIGYENLKIFDY